jgi:excisionase family DNA binding protein
MAKIKTENLLRVNDVAARLRLTPTTIYKRIKDGSIPALRINSRVIRIPESSVTKFLGAR